jgi:hypothetical protein
VTNGVAERTRSLASITRFRGNLSLTVPPTSVRIATGIVPGMSTIAPDVPNARGLQDGENNRNRVEAVSDHGNESSREINTEISIVKEPAN